MAVVQISRIQIRRGQKNQGSGLPQLASGELGWAIDTREMYIGNGAVSEGAPAVGNTKILTEYDDLFDLANTYAYKSTDSNIVTGPNSSSPVNRTLQARLDDRVSVRAFGAKGDGVSDDTAALQRAFDQLYLNTSNKDNPASRVKLRIEAGVYNISGTLYIPPYASLEGEGIDKTIIKQLTAGTSLFQTVNSLSTPGSPADDAVSTTLNQAQQIQMEGFTLEASDPCKMFVLQSCRDSLFKNIRIKNVWEAGDTIEKTNLGLEINSLSGVVQSSNNLFDNVNFDNISYAVISNWDVENNKFINCKFNTLGYGIVLGEDMILGTPGSGQNVGPSYFTIRDSEFTAINKQALWVVNGEGNVSENNKYNNVGNDGDATEYNPVTSVIRYNKATNKSNNDFFSRTGVLAFEAGTGQVPYIPEVQGSGMYTLAFEHKQDVSAGTRLLFRIPNDGYQSYTVDYTLFTNSYNAQRQGTLFITTNPSGNPVDVQISDEYDFVGEEEFSDRFTFSFTRRSLGNPLTTDTIDININSSMPNSGDVEFKFNVNAKKTVL